MEEGKNSKLLITTQEKARLISYQKNKSYWLQLSGFNPEEGAQILSENGVLSSNMDDLLMLSKELDGNPLMLRLVSSFLHQYFEGNLEKAKEIGLIKFEDFVEQIGGEYRGIEVKLNYILDQHINRLPKNLLELLERLSVYRTPFSENAVVASVFRAISF